MRRLSLLLQAVGATLIGAMVGAVVGMVLVFGILSVYFWDTHDRGVGAAIVLGAVIIGLPFGVLVGALAGLWRHWRRRMAARRRCQ